jgi:transposase-like protein
MERRKFKLEAVRLIKERGVSSAQASEDLGIRPPQLRDWVKKFAEAPQHAFPWSWPDEARATGDRDRTSTRDTALVIDGTRY